VAQGQLAVGGKDSLLLSGKLLKGLERRASLLDERLEEKTQSYLKAFRKTEEKLRRKLWKKDSVKAKQLFQDLDKQYASLTKAPSAAARFRTGYKARLDSLATSLRFLGGVSAPPQLQATVEKYTALQGKLDQTQAINQFLGERQRQLREELGKLGMLKELKGFQKQAYYYSAQVKEYKQLLADPSKWEKKLLELALGSSAFKDFFARNSGLASLFPLGGGGGAASAVSLQGMQTRASLQAGLQARFGTGPGVQQALQGNIQAAQGQLQEVKNKLASLGAGSVGSGGEVNLPEGFKPNGQKTKTFLQRLEYGVNIQSQGSSTLFPVTTDFGLSLGYKLNDKSVVGLGLAYKLGWGRGWDKIQLSSEGLGLRSFLDYKIKGGFFLTGGMELNYRSQFRSMDQLRDFSAWQRSGLLGLAKKYKMGGKLKGDVRLLWDFLSYGQVPRTQAILFRVGYSIK
jgi:hypothetical protein